MSENKGIHISPLLLASRLRAVVLALGESVFPVWWKTEFMDPASITEPLQMVLESGAVRVLVPVSSKTQFAGFLKT